MRDDISSFFVALYVDLYVLSLIPLSACCINASFVAALALLFLAMVPGCGGVTGLLVFWFLRRAITPLGRLRHPVPYISASITLIYGDRHICVISQKKLIFNLRIALAHENGKI